MSVVWSQPIRRRVPQPVATIKLVNQNCFERAQPIALTLTFTCLPDSRAQAVLRMLLWLLVSAIITLHVEESCPGTFDNLFSKLAEDQDFFGHSDHNASTIPCLSILLEICLGLKVPTGATLDKSGDDLIFATMIYRPQLSNHMRRF